MTSPPMDPGERRRLATHEAGHCAASVLLEFADQGAVSLVAGRDFAGIACTGSPPQPSADDVTLEALDRPWPLVPASAKRWLEGTIMSLLAGDLAEARYYWAAGTSDHPEPPSPGPATPGPGLAVSERVLLAERSAAAEVKHDAAQVTELLFLLHGSDKAVTDAHREYLRVQTRRLLATDRARRMVAALSDRLMVRDQLAAAEWVPLLQAIE